MGGRVMQAVTSTLCEQFGPAIREPQSISTNSHHQLGTQMVGGTVHWQAAVNGGPLTVTFVPAPSISMSPHQPVAPMPFSLPPIEDGSEVTGLPIPLPNPFPGPVVPGMATCSLHQMVPIHTPLPVPQRTTTGPEVYRPQEPPWRPSEWIYRPLDMGQRLWFRRRPSHFLTASSTPSICVNYASFLRRLSSGDSRSPSHKRTSGTMLPPFLYSFLLSLAHLPSLLSPPAPILFLLLVTQIWIPNLASSSLPPASLPLSLSVAIASPSRSSTQAVAYAFLSSPTKNSNRSKCSGSACGGGKPGISE